MEDTLLNRIKTVIEQSGLTVNQFASRIGFQQGNLSQILNGKRNPNNKNLINAITSTFNIREEWLRFGSGAEYKQSNAVEFHPSRQARIPLVSQYAHAGYLCGYGDPEYLGALPTIDFTPDREMTGNWLAFEVKGDSMDNGSKESYVEGEIVICREVEREYWRDSRLFINKRDFVIVHEEGILIKRITEHNLDTHTITIHSLNPMYPDRTLNLEQVHQIFSIVESRVQRRR